MPLENARKNLSKKMYWLMLIAIGFQTTSIVRADDNKVTQWWNSIGKTADAIVDPTDENVLSAAVTGTVAGGGTALFFWSLQEIRHAHDEKIRFKQIDNKNAVDAGRPPEWTNLKEIKDPSKLSRLCFQVERGLAFGFGVVTTVHTLAGVYAGGHMIANGKNPLTAQQQIAELEEAKANAKVVKNGQDFMEKERQKAKVEKAKLEEPKPVVVSAPEQEKSPNVNVVDGRSVRPGGIFAPPAGEPEAVQTNTLSPRHDPRSLKVQIESPKPEMVAPIKKFNLRLDEMFVGFEKTAANRTKNKHSNTTRGLIISSLHRPPYVEKFGPQRLQQEKNLEAAVNAALTRDSVQRAAEKTISEMEITELREHFGKLSSGAERKKYNELFFNQFLKNLLPKYENAKFNDELIRYLEKEFTEKWNSQGE
jgi:hypothetical protein